MSEDTPQGRLILVTGGARSGKSSYAERLVARLAEAEPTLQGRVVYVATSQTYDEEMEQRVAVHQSARPETWVTVECPLDVPRAVRDAAAAGAAAGAGLDPASPEPASPDPASPDPASPVVLLDCVTLWVTNLLFSGGAFGGSAPPDEGYNWDKDLLPQAEEQAAAERVTAAVEDLIAAVAQAGVTLVAVTNEVGLGVVPEYPLARLYRDQLGWANQRLARAADKVYFLVSGFPLDVKALAAPDLFSPGFAAADPFDPSS